MPPGSGSTSRRAFAPVAAALALALALAACPNGGGRSPNGRGSPGVKASRGGELVVAYPYEPVTLNPFLVGGDAPPTRDLVRPLMPGLYRLGPKGARVPWLLASEPAAADVGGTPFSVRLRLRADAVWSDGRPITASDLRFTWRAVMASPGIATKDGYDRLSDVVVESAAVARLVFKAPYARWRDLFSAGLGVLPSHVLARTDISKALGRSWPVSGGPFVLKAWTPGLEMLFERNPRAWGTEPLLDRIRVQFVPDPVTALQLYARGRVDVIGPYFAAELRRRATAARSGSTVSSDRGATWVGLFLNVRTPAISDARVRRALTRGINRPAIVEGLVREQGEVLDAPSAGASERASPSFARFSYSPSGAEQLLDRVGWTSSGTADIRRKGGRELTITVASVSSDELAQRVLRAMNAHARRVGIDLNLISLDSDELWDSWLTSSRFQAALLVQRDPPGGSLRSRFGVAGPHNVSKVADGSLGRLLDGADRTLDDTAVAVDAPFTRMAELIPAIPLFRFDVTLAARPGVNEVAAIASADGFLVNADRWWITGATPSPAAS